MAATLVRSNIATSLIAMTLAAVFLGVIAISRSDVVALRGGRLCAILVCWSSMADKIPSVVKCDRCGRLSPVEGWDPVYEDPIAVRHRLHAATSQGNQLRDSLQ